MASFKIPSWPLPPALTDSSISVGEGTTAVVGGTARTFGNVATAPLTALEKPSEPHHGNISDTLRDDQTSAPLT
jgi:hypothetical protein